MTRIHRIILRHQIAAARLALVGEPSKGPDLEYPPPRYPGDWMPQCRASVITSRGRLVLVHQRSGRQ